ncbi:UNVERIFIED_CONTAM: hypothetical protein PYX00_002190 [Menopon gallinae]|uniref:Uncharacterized protein n=1 Tax=Menopon gallinae TaxID=328185 RepID=A0AAW2IHZ6_9NEOP
MAAVAPPRSVRGVLPRQRLRRPRDLQAGRRSGPGRDRGVQSESPAPAAAFGEDPPGGGRGQRLLHAGGDRGDPRRVLVRLEQFADGVLDRKARVQREGSQLRGRTRVRRTRPGKSGTSSRRGRGSW